MNDNYDPDKIYFFQFFHNFNDSTYYKSSQRLAQSLFVLSCEQKLKSSDELTKNNNNQQKKIKQKKIKKQKIKKQQIKKQKNRLENRLENDQQKIYQKIVNKNLKMNKNYYN